MKPVKTAVIYLITLLSLLLLPFAVFADGGESGTEHRFALAAIDSEGTVIAPCFVGYEEGQTIKEALKNSGHEFLGIDEDWIDTIDGHYDDKYVRFYDNGTGNLVYDLNAPAASVQTAFLFATSDTGVQADHLDLVLLLAQYEEKDPAMQKYGPVKKAYAAAMEALPTANATKAKTLADNLRAAYEQYETWKNQAPCSVVIKPMQNGANVSAKITLTDTMGNTYTQEGTAFRAELLEETYAFVIRKGAHEVSGTLEIKKDDRKLTIAPELPFGNWFGTITIKDDRNDSTGVPMETNGDVTTVKILDTTYSPYITIEPGADIPLKADGNPNTSDYSVYSEHTSFALGRNYGDESVTSNKITWNSTAKRLVQVAEAGLVEKSVPLKVIHKDPATGYTQRQYRTLILQKIPILKGLKVTAGKNELVLTPAFTVRGTAYSAETIADSVQVSASSFDHANISDPYAVCGEYKDGYRIEIGGTAQEENGSVSVPANGQPVEIKVIGNNGFSTTATLTVRKVEAKTIKVTKPSADTEVTLKSPGGSILQPDIENETEAIFSVASGTYTWITTKDTRYHACGAVQTGASSVTVAGASPVKEKLLNGIGMFSSMSQKAMEFQEADGRAFRWDEHEYSYLFSDFATSVYVVASFDSGVSVTREAYTRSNGYPQPEAKLTSGTRSILTGFIMQGSTNNEIILTASKTSGNVTYYQDYVIRSKRFATLDSLAISDQADNPLQILANGNINAKEFDSDITEYTLSVGESMEEIRITAGFSNPGMDVSMTGESTIRMGGTSFKKSESGKTVSQRIALDPQQEEETVSIEVFDDNAENRINTYHLKVKKVPPVSLTFKTVPENATVLVTDVISKKRVLPKEDGSFPLLSGFQYTYTATAYGYVGTSGTIEKAANETVRVTLNPAPANPAVDSTIQAEWPYFRADETNNGVISAPVPKDPEDTVLYWAKRIGEGYSSNAAGCPILADGFLYTYSGNRIVKLDPMTGEIKAEGTMMTGSAFAINSPTYAEGMIFVGLNNGGVQAFNAKTLESLWTYKDPLGGQPNCQITYKNGYLYTGFWNSETMKANLVCLSVTDENPNMEREEKYPVWTYTGNGFYWAGAYASDRFVLVGSDDGKLGYTSGCGALLSFDALTGNVIDQIDDQFTGDIRSSICYDTVSDRYYFVTKDGLFCSVKVNEDGTFRKETVTKLQLYEMNGAKGMSTSTPVVHNGRAYVGVSGTGTFAQYTGHNITVIDLTGSKPVKAYQVATQGYPQTSGLLTTAYEGGSGSVYVYFFDNFTPGKLRMIKDQPGQTEPDAETLAAEEYEQSGIDMKTDVAKALFTPYGDQAQYAICSPIVDEYGNIYFKNDSAYMMMIGAKITELKVTKMPDKTDYMIGELFDPDGMQVTATYANGKTRDVTEYIQYTTDPLTGEDTTIDLLFDLGENMNMYQDHEGVAGTRYFVPQTSLNIKVTDGGFVPEVLTSVELSATELEYTGETLRPTIVSVNGNTKLEEGTDYRVFWPEESKMPGTYKVKVKGIGKCTGSVFVKYSIKQTKEPETLTSLTISQNEFTYNGKEQRPEIWLINETDKLKENVDYTVTRPEESVEPGFYTLTVTGIGEYTGSLTEQYTIVEAPEKIPLTSLELSAAELRYNGNYQHPEIESFNGSAVLKEGEDYTVEWPAESEEPGKYLVYATGIGRFEGEVKASYEIYKKDPAPITQVRLTKTVFLYNGTNQRPEISKVNGSYDLYENIDYEVTWPKASVKPGIYSVTVTGMGDYYGAQTVYYTIEPDEIITATLSKTAFTYNKKVQKPKIAKVRTAEGRNDLVEGRDYKVTWPKGCVNAGTYKVTVQGIGNYTGKTTAVFTIDKAAGKLTVKPGKKTIKAKQTFKLQVANPNGAKLSFKVTKGKKFVKLVKKGKTWYVKGLRKGKVEVTVTCAAIGNYKKIAKVVKITVK